MCVSTSDNLSSPWVSLQSTEQDFRLVCTVYTWLDHLLEHSVHWPRSKVVWQMLHLLPVQVEATVSMLIHIHTHWNNTQERQWPDEIIYERFKSVQNKQALIVTCWNNRVVAWRTFLWNLDAGQLCRVLENLGLSLKNTFICRHALT